MTQPPARKRLWPFVCLAVLVVATAIVYWPASDRLDLPPPLTLEQAKALPDEQLALAVSQDVSARLLRAGSQPGAWRTLPEPARHLWVATTMVPDLVRGGSLTFLMIRPDDAPGLAEAAAACTALGATQLAATCNEAIQVAAAAGGQAVATCRAYAEQEHTPPFVRPPGLVDPFAAIDGRFSEAMAHDGFDQRCLAYAKQHLAAIIGGP